MRAAMESQLMPPRIELTYMQLLSSAATVRLTWAPSQGGQH